MTSSPITYPDWKAPPEDGQFLLWPAAFDLLRQTAENHAHLTSAHSVLFQNVSLPELRLRQRQWIGHSDDSQLLFAAGHQTELHHPGVWIKNAIISAAAHKVGGIAIHFAIDTDEPKHLALRWPGGSIPLTDDPALFAVPWAALLASPSLSHLQQIETSLSASSSWNFQPIIPAFLQSLRRLSTENLDLPSALANSLHLLDWELGLNYQSLVASPLWMAPPYLLFIHHILARADEFAAHYNASLAEYRHQNNIRTPGRPMPDLAQSPSSCETPFWLDDLSSRRRFRATVTRSADHWQLLSPQGDPFPLDPSADGWSSADRLSDWLQEHHLRLSPRALTLTLFLRLALVDQFTHGIGGARYDQVTDELIRRCFNIEPSHFSVATATLYFPTAIHRQRVCLPCLVQKEHRLKHSLLGPQKQHYLNQIASSPRKSLQRREIFHEMHRQLSQAAQSNPELQNWPQFMRQAESRHQEDQSLFDRELFYALQPRPRLESLIDRCYQQF